jgi:multidrug efflux pump subunit AcrA (membrane-fusion protein)
MVVPSAVIKQDITGAYLYTMQQVDGKWIAKKVYIKTGESYQDKTMVLEGIKVGEQVIILGYNQVSDGSEVYVSTENAS